MFLSWNCLHYLQFNDIRAPPDSRLCKSLHGRKEKEKDGNEEAAKDLCYYLPQRVSLLACSGDLYFLLPSSNSNKARDHAINHYLQHENSHTSWASKHANNLTPRRSWYLKAEITVMIEVCCSSIKTTIQQASSSSNGSRHEKWHISQGDEMVHNLGMITELLRISCIIDFYFYLLWVHL